MTILTKCISCEAYFEGDSTRCASCVDVLEYRQLEGSRIIVGVLSQRELARIKKEFYQAEQVVAALEERKAEFMRMALAEAEKLVQEVEAEIGQPVADRDSHDAHAAPGRAAEPSDTLSLNARDDAVGVAVVIAVASEKPHQTLVYDWRRHDLDPGKLADALDQAAGMRAATVDEVADA